MTKPLLSICIPTYNRAEYLRETLAALLVTMQGLEDSVELVVSDNASPDHTAQVLSEYRDKFPVMRCHRNEENIGEMNFYAVTQRARGEYIWLLGDDDRMAPELLPAVFQRLEKKPDLIVCNHSIHSTDFSQLYKAAFYPVSAQEVLHSRDMVLGTFGVGLSFISAAIFRRENFARIGHAEHAQFGRYGLSFLYALCASLPADSQTEFIREPLLHNRAGNSIIPDWSVVFVDGINIVLTALRERGYSPQAIRRAKERAVRDYILPRLTFMKKNGAPTTSFLRRVFPIFKQCQMFWWVVVPIYCFPYSVIRVIQRFRH